MSPSTQVRETLRDSRAAQLTELVRRPVEAMAFWAAIVLPFVYLPLLVGGFDDTTSLLLFVGLVAANVLALFVGHDHKRE